MQEKQEFIVDGFSSEEELLHEEIYLQDKKKQTIENPQKEEVKLKIPPPQQIKKKSYSLTPDIATGWAPKSDLPVPIPLLFQDRRVDQLVRKVMQKQSTDIKVSFLGQRFENTYYAWLNKQFDFPYQHIKAAQNMKFSNRAFCGQNQNAYHGVIFDSTFESANLDCVFQVDQRQYDLFLRVDSNTKGHIQWYNFKMKNLQKLQKYKINICNFQKCHSLYSRGMKPYVYSLKKAQKQKIGWHQAGQFIRYERKPSKVNKALNIQNFNSFKLTFQYYTEYENDQLQVAYCVPYTYSKLKNYLSEMGKKNKDYLKINKLCTSLGGLDVPLLIIHEEQPTILNHVSSKKNSLNSSINISKKCILISGRAHPGQSNGSYMMEGFINFLCSQSKQARQLRKNVIFKIVPMLNPDGVALGNYRTGISGKDFNRQYRDPEKQIFPQVYSFKKLVAENKAIFGDNLLMFLDFHGHSIKKNVFMYGPQFPIIDRNYYETRVFPKILSNYSEMFRYYSCIFKISADKVTTARAILLRKLMIPCSYTIEASNGSYYDKQLLKNILFDEKSWIEMGAKIGMSLNEYSQLIISNQKIRLERLKQRKARSNHTKSMTANDTVLALKNDEKKFKSLFQEIKKMEEERQEQKNSEDQLSQGSSDGEDSKEDLPASKMKQLVQLIKNKKNKVNQKHKKEFLEESQHFRTEINEESITTEYQKTKEVSSKKHIVKISPEKIQQKQSQIFNKKSLRFHLQRNKNHSSSFKTEKQKIPTRVINFSFISGSKPKITRPHELINSSAINKRVLLDLYKDHPSQEKEFPEIKEKHRVLDLSQNLLKINNGYERKKESPERKLTDRNIHSPRKVSKRFEHYKFKRLILDQYEV